MASRDISDLDPDLQGLCEEFLAHAKVQGIDCFVTTTYRSNEEQDALYAQGRTTPGSIVTHAKAGQSAHNCTLNGKPAAQAFDIALRKNGKIDWDTNNPNWQELAQIGRDLGLVWGGDWKTSKDWPHFELKEFSERNES